MNRQTRKHEEPTAYERDVDMLSHDWELVGAAAVTLACRKPVFMPSESGEETVALAAN